MKERNAELERLRTELRNKTAESDDWKSKYNNLLNKYNSEKTAFEARISDLTNQLQARDRDLNEWKNKYSALEGKFNNLGS